jgi:hypothetical protein
MSQSTVLIYSWDVLESDFFIVDFPVVQTTQQINNCPAPSRIFHGRLAILEKMHEFFKQDIRTQHIYLLHGLGGAGKTQIGLKFIKNSP